MLKEPLSSGSKGTSGTDKAVNKVQVGVQIVRRGNVDTPEVRRIPATEA